MTTYSNASYSSGMSSTGYNNIESAINNMASSVNTSSSSNSGCTSCSCNMNLSASISNLVNNYIQCQLKQLSLNATSGNFIYIPESELNQSTCGSNTSTSTTTPTVRNVCYQKNYFYY